MKLTPEQKYHLIESLVGQALEDDINAGGGLIDYLLRNGFKGFNNMSEEELINEINEQLGEEYLDEFLQGE